MSITDSADAMASALSTRRLLPSDAPAFQALRLAALRDCPSAFSASFEAECDTPLATIAANLGQRQLFGVFAGQELAGMTGLARETSAKLRHKAEIRAMYVAARYRGKGAGRLLLEHALSVAATMDGLCQLTLVVTAGNASAQALYAAHGFVVYGCEPRALLVDGVFYDNVLMGRTLA